MANEVHLTILRQGVSVWNQWRIESREVIPDLSGAVLSEAELSGAILDGADLSGAILGGADLKGALLDGADLNGAFLSRADLSAANLSAANLSHAFLRAADLSNAIISKANLSHVDLTNAIIINTDLSDANLRDANLRSATLISDDLRGTDLNNARIAWTIFNSIDLSEVEGLENIYHEGPSSIGIDTIYLSKGNIPYKFLLEAGVPKDAIPYLLSLTGKAIDFYSCFISCSSQDKAFVDRLHADLQAKGIRCWVAWEDLKIGEPFLLGIDKGIQLHDKLLLVLSENSVTSGWVQQEVLSALAKEQGKEPWVLFPVRLDETVMQTSVPWVHMIRQSRHIGDFTQWKDHDTYQKAFDRLLRDLKMAS